jgi:opacity protein-like surface antigen
MKKLRIPFVILAVLAFSATGAEAQRFGAQLNWADDMDLGIGARLELPLNIGAEGVLSYTYLIGSFDYFFPDCDDCTYFEFNGNLAVPVNVESSLNPYVGAGLNMARFSVDVAGSDVSNTDLGLNLLGGLKFALGGVSSFGEARFELGGGEQFVLTFGILFGGNR